MAEAQSPRAYQKDSLPSLEAGIEAYGRETRKALPQGFFRLSPAPEVNSRLLSGLYWLFVYTPPRYIMTLDQNVLATSGIDPRAVQGFFEGYYSKSGNKELKVSPQPSTIASGSIVDEKVYHDAFNRGIKARKSEKAKPGDLKAGV